MYIFKTPNGADTWCEKTKCMLDEYYVIEENYALFIAKEFYAYHVSVLLEARIHDISSVPPPHTVRGDFKVYIRAHGHEWPATLPRMLRWVSSAVGSFRLDGGTWVAPILRRVPPACASPALVRPASVSCPTHTCWGWRQIRCGYARPDVECQSVCARCNQRTAMHCGRLPVRPRGVLKYPARNGLLHLSYTCCLIKRLSLCSALRSAA